MPNFFSSQSSVVVVLCGFVECVASGFVDATRGVRKTGGFFVFCKHLQHSRSADLRIDDFKLGQSVARASPLVFVDLGGG